LSWDFPASSGFAGESLRAPGSRAAGAGAVFKNGKLIERPDGSEVMIGKSRDAPIHRS
jgi:hypothetical protein